MELGKETREVKVHVDNLTKRFGDLLVLDQISFVDAPEGCVAFTIRTGAEPEAAAESVLTDNVAPWQELFIIYNANKEAVEFRLPGGKGSDPEQEPSENYFALEGKWQLLTDGTRFKNSSSVRLKLSII